jgi:hypothetical protein
MTTLTAALECPCRRCDAVMPTDDLFQVDPVPYPALVDVPLNVVILNRMESAVMRRWLRKYWNDTVAAAMIGAWSVHAASAQTLNLRYAQAYSAA